MALQWGQMASGITGTLINEKISIRELGNFNVKDNLVEIG